MEPSTATTHPHRHVGEDPGLNALIDLIRASVIGERDVSYADGAMTWAAHRRREPVTRLADYLAEARALLARPPRVLAGPTIADGAVGADLDPLRWFLLPKDACVAAADIAAADG